MKIWCYGKCNTYTEHTTVEFLDDGMRDIMSGQLSDYRKIKCGTCGNEYNVDLAPDKR